MEVIGVSIVDLQASVSRLGISAAEEDEGNDGKKLRENRNR